MIEGMLWTMAEPLLQAQLGAPPQPRGNAGDACVPHGAWRCAGEDDWLALAATGDDEWRALCALAPALTPFAEWGLAERRERSRSIDAALAAWLLPQGAADAARRLRDAGVPAAALASALDLVAEPHLLARGFWDGHEGVIPGLPWRASFGRRSGPAPGLGADTEAVLYDVLGYTAADVTALHAARAFG
jgi:crotonobetainyl-CoA:carnitine CoA-transferase CaiB-like acyl-CoA transferase